MKDARPLERGQISSVPIPMWPLCKALHYDFFAGTTIEFSGNRSSRQINMAFVVDTRSCTLNLAFAITQHLLSCGPVLVTWKDVGHRVLHVRQGDTDELVWYFSLNCSWHPIPRGTTLADFPPNLAMLKLLNTEEFLPYLRVVDESIRSALVPMPYGHAVWAISPGQGQGQGQDLLPAELRQLLTAPIYSTMAFTKAREQQSESPWAQIPFRVFSSYILPFVRL